MHRRVHPLPLQICDPVNDALEVFPRFIETSAVSHWVECRGPITRRGLRKVGRRPGLSSRREVADTLESNAGTGARKACRDILRDLSALLLDSSSRARAEQQVPEF